MPIQLLAVVIVGLTVIVVIALFLVLWRERKTPRQAAVAVISGIVLAAWAVTATLIAKRGLLRPPDSVSVPPIGINLAIVFAGLALALIASSSLRSLLSNQEHLTQLNLWRLVGVVFLFLAAKGQMPALWAWPAGIGDIIVGLAAIPVARRVGMPQGRKLAIAFNLFGMLDLIVAVGLGMTTSPGPLHLFHTTPTSEFATTFPLALVPSFLVPLAFMIHIVSLWQLRFGTWSRSAKAGA